MFVLELYTTVEETLTPDQHIISTFQQNLRYSSNIKRIWRLQVEDNHRLWIIFLVLDIEYHYNCDYDSVLVKESKERQHTFCLEDFHQTDSLENSLNADCDPSVRLSYQNMSYESFQNNLEISFYADFSIERYGFILYWSDIDLTPQRQTFDDDSGIVVSPNYPNNYLKNLRLRYYINASNNGFIYMELLKLCLSERDRCKDMLVLSLLASNITLCGCHELHVPRFFITDQEKVELEFFTTADTLSGEGFHLTYKLGEY